MITNYRIFAFKLIWTAVLQLLTATAIIRYCDWDLV